MAPEANTDSTEHEQEHDDDHTANCNINVSPHAHARTHTPLPDWVRVGSNSADWGELLKVSEWQEDDDDDDGGGDYRSNNGWKGRDLVHDRNSPVRVLDYYVRYGPGIHIRGDDNSNNSNSVYKSFPKGGVDTTLTGIVHFTKRAESHKGYCHGGSMCSIMDDVIGWVGFLATGECLPWSGFTVQVNSKLQKPVRVDSILMVKATITNIERRKVSIEAVISDPSESQSESQSESKPSGGNPKRDPSVHATASGLVVVNRGVLCEERQPQQTSG
eukprot:jgi/Psemu1/313416/fgenesh1_kg.1188_\